MSSLAAQLSQSASLNTALLTDRSKRKPAESFLFTGRDADQHDLDSIYALATNAFLKLCSIDERLKRFEHELFSDRARGLDRTLLGREEDQKLSDVIGEFLRFLGSWMLEIPTSRVVEWLVRRFRVNEFHVESLLASFLPYHDTAQFAKLVTILHIKPNSTWSFLLPFKSAAQNVPRVSLVTEMLRNADVARFVVSLLPSALKENRVHRVLLAFNAATLHEFITRSKALDEGTMAYVLPAVLEPLEKQHGASKDAILGGFILLSAFSRKNELSTSALTVIIRSMTACAEAVATKQFINAVIAVCEPQTELPIFPGSTIKAILKMPDFREELRDAIGWAGSEKFIGPLVPALISKLPGDRPSTLLETILSAPAVPSSLVGRTTSLLVKEFISEDASEKAAACRSLLSVIQQRHPGVFQRIAQLEKDEDEELQEGINRLILSLSLVSADVSPNKDKTDMVLASNSADANVRAIAVKELLSSLSNPSLSAVDKTSITSALISRIHDPEQPVLAALYERPELLTLTLASEAPAYISTLSEALGSKPKRSSLRLHLAFALKYLYPTLGPEYKEELIAEILFPFLLFSKPQQHKAETAWNIMAENMNEEVGREFEILKGCVGVVKAEREKAVEDAVEKMKGINAALSVKMAQNILTSNQLLEHLSKLLKRIRSANPPTRALRYLVLGALLGRLSGEIQIDIAKEILGVMNLEEISGIEDLLPNNGQFAEALRENAGKSVILKPNRQSTLSWLQVSLIVTICTIPAPDGLVLNWLSGQPSSSTRDTHGSKYVALMRTTYALVNRSPSLPVLTSCLLSSLFINLKSDVLVFLAGIWTSSSSLPNIGASGGSSSCNGSRLLQEIALQHAAAFLEAHVLEDDGVDFQTIVPALLVALQNPSSTSRKAATECLNRIRLISERKLKSVYKFDAVYGDAKDTLQYLDQDDFKKYLGYLNAYQQHYVQDPAYLRAVHAEHLTPVKGDKRKYTRFKQNVLYYLLSHVNALDTESTKIQILESLSLVSSNVKGISLLPSIKAISAHHGGIALGCLLISCIDGSSIAQMNDPEGGLWEVYIQLLRQYLHPASASDPREVLIQLLETEIFDKLDYEKQMTVCKTVLEVVARGSSSSYGKNLLSNIIKDVPLIVGLLNNYAPTPQGSTPRATKRAKIIESTEVDDTTAGLSFLAEVLGTISLPGSLDLVAALLDTLSKLIQSTPIPQADINYIEQMLMSAIDNTASNILENPNITPSVVRLDVLVEIIRTVGNPQTFHQALLLVASLARLAPESVLHNVMPVFTFMGSNVFHRDDTYSFRVVQKTIDGIVPVMASSLKNANNSPLDLYIASRSFLQVFTDASNHIPRHRRNNFFIHLVDVLGPEHFLVPICMLLAEKLSNRVVRQNQEEIFIRLALPITLLHRATSPIQANALLQFLEEAQRLAICATSPTNKVASFLDHAVDGETTIPVGTYVKRSHTLITLVGQAVQSDTLANLDGPGQGSLNSLVSGLINLATVDEDVSAAKLSGLATAARSTLGKILNAMPVVTFMDTCLFMLASDSTVIHVGTLVLLNERIPRVADHVRRDITAEVDGIVGLATRLLSQDNTRLRVQSLRTLATVGSTLAPGEEGALTGSLPSILDALNTPDLVDHALNALIPLSSKLGPRIIPFFQDIVIKSVFLLSGTDNTALEKASAILHGLLTSIPAFWGKDTLTQMVKVYTDHWKVTLGSPKAPVSSLMRAITKKVPTNILLPSLLDSWVTISSKQNFDGIIAYSDLLTRTIRHASKAAVLEQIKALSKILLEAFDIAKNPSWKDSKAEAHVISVFREFVVKLNESTFRPIFRRFYDWAFIVDTADTARKITFCHAYSNLLDFFKALMVPYTSFLMPAFELYFKSLPHSVDEESAALWISLIATLKKSLANDDGGFWRDDKLRQITIPLLQQMPLCANFSEELGAKSTFQHCLDALVEGASDDALLKSINLGVLMHTRSENTKVRQFALVCSEALWRAQGGKLLGFVSETSTFIAECGEDENDAIVKASFRLKDAVESVAGKIDGL